MALRDDPQLRADVAELIYRTLDDHGWADHYRCGWDGNEPPDLPCGKEYAEWESVREIADAVVGMVSQRLRTA